MVPCVNIHLRLAATFLGQAQAQAVADAAAQGQPAPRLEGISLRQRSKPIIDMLQRCHQAAQPIVWGV
jgi:hypothetical protein